MTAMPPRVDFLAMGDAAGEAKRVEALAGDMSPAAAAADLKYEATSGAIRSDGGDRSSSPGGDVNSPGGANKRGRDLMRACADAFLYGSAFHGSRCVRQR
jgi:hypothetical protein